MTEEGKKRCDYVRKIILFNPYGKSEAEMIHFVAKKVGVTVNSVLNWYHRRGAPSSTKYETILRSFDVDESILTVKKPNTIPELPKEDFSNRTIGQEVCERKERIKNTIHNEMLTVAEISDRSGLPKHAVRNTLEDIMLVDGSVYKCKSYGSTPLPPSGYHILYGLPKNLLEDDMDKSSQDDVVVRIGKNQRAILAYLKTVKDATATEIEDNLGSFDKNIVCRILKRLLKYKLISYRWSKGRGNCLRALKCYYVLENEKSEPKKSMDCKPVEKSVAKDGKVERKSGTLNEVEKDNHVDFLKSLVHDNSGGFDDTKAKITVSKATFERIQELAKQHPRIRLGIIGEIIIELGIDKANEDFRNVTKYI